MFGTNTMEHATGMFTFVSGGFSYTWESRGPI